MGLPGDEGALASIFRVLSRLLETILIPSPRVALLGLLEDMGGIRGDQSLLGLGTLLANGTLLSTGTPPTQLP